MRADPHEMLVDTMISAESFFGGREKTPAEQTFRISMRAAHFLGDTFEDRRKIFKTFVKAYHARNRIVHGSRPSDPLRVAGEALTLLELGKRAGDFVKDALQKSLTVPEFREREPDSEYWNNLLLKLGPNSQ